MKKYKPKRGFVAPIITAVASLAGAFGGGKAPSAPAPQAPPPPPPVTPEATVNPDQVADQEVLADRQRRRAAASVQDQNLQDLNSDTSKTNTIKSLLGD